MHAEIAARGGTVSDATKGVLHDLRKPSLNIGTRDPYAASDSPGELHPVLKATLGIMPGNSRGIAPGDFLTHLWKSRSRDMDEQREGKAWLAEHAVYYMDAPDKPAISFKATLGTTGATGGYVLPNNAVDAVLKPATAEAVYSDLVTVRTGINVRGVDQPYRLGPAQQATFQPWGNTKTNVNEAYGSYTANLGTLAMIYDQAKQYARFSAGAAEADAMDELARGFRLAENFAILAGAGTVNTGTGDPTSGIYTALNASSSFTGYTTDFSGTANASTVAGSAAVGLRQGMKALATRSRYPNAIVMDPVTYFTLYEQGSDTAGFWVSDFVGSGFHMAPNGALIFQGIPILWDPNYNTNTATTKGAIVGDFKALKLYRGLEFRIDVSDVAGTRWDTNEIGYRAESELGVNAYTAVNVGAFQLIKGLIP